LIVYHFFGHDIDMIWYQKKYDIADLWGAWGLAKIVDTIFNAQLILFFTSFTYLWWTPIAISNLKNLLSLLAAAVNSEQWTVNNEECMYYRNMLCSK
jgi:hypothetical protein